MQLAASLQIASIAEIVFVAGVPAALTFGDSQPRQHFVRGAYAAADCTAIAACLVAGAERGSDADTIGLRRSASREKNESEKSFQSLTFWGTKVLLSCAFNQPSIDKCCTDSIGQCEQFGKIVVALRWIG